MNKDIETILLYRRKVKRIYNFIKGEMCDVEKWELLRLVKKDIKSRQRKLKQIGIVKENDWRFKKI